jgi:hypothetical protein
VDLGKCALPLLVANDHGEGDVVRHAFVTQCVIEKTARLSTGDYSAGGDLNGRRLPDASGHF